MSDCADVVEILIKDTQAAYDKAFDSALGSLDPEGPFDRLWTNLSQFKLIVGGARHTNTRLPPGLADNVKAVFAAWCDAHSDLPENLLAPFRDFSGVLQDQYPGTIIKCAAVLRELCSSPKKARTEM
tara:strand:+ start:44 stop:424 length:381 start_codon:yes stop_codon:yes gene_type:complete